MSVASALEGWDVCAVDYSDVMIQATRERLTLLKDRERLLMNACSGDADSAQSLALVGLAAGAAADQALVQTLTRRLEMLCKSGLEQLGYWDVALEYIRTQSQQKLSTLSQYNNQEFYRWGAMNNWEKIKANLAATAAGGGGGDLGGGEGDGAGGRGGGVGGQGARGGEGAGGSGNAGGSRGGSPKSSKSDEDSKQNSQGGDSPGN